MQNRLENYHQKGLIKPIEKLKNVFEETEELTAIIAKSTDTAQKTVNLNSFISRALKIEY